MKNKYGQTPQEAARARVLMELHMMVTEDHYYRRSDDTDSFHREVLKHYAKINNTLAYKWGMDENTIDMKEVK